MKYIIHFDIRGALVAIFILGVALWITWILGYVKGVKKAERQFCDKFVSED